MRRSCTTSLASPGIALIKTVTGGDREFKVVDTGGLVFDDDSEFLPEIREQAALALDEASVALGDC